MKDKVILTDCDGVLLDWDYSFRIWMVSQGYKVNPQYQDSYSVSEKYSVTTSKAKDLIEFFNNSSHIAFLTPFRDAVHYVNRLFEQHGYVFHVITSLSKDPHSAELRTINLKKLFNKNCFEKIICLDTGADKHEALELYKGTQCFWIEDKLENAELGLDYGLTSILMEHGHNSHSSNDQLLYASNWSSIYDIIIR